MRKKTILNLKISQAKVPRIQGEGEWGIEKLEKWELGC